MRAFFNVNKDFFYKGKYNRCKKVQTFYIDLVYKFTKLNPRSIIKDMKTSRTVSEIKQTDKTVYPKCNMKKEHEKQSLNLICLTKTCKFHGPICALCKKQHSGHNVLPIKTFISNITDSHKKFFFPLKKIEEEQILEIQEKPKKKPAIKKLQESFNEIMGLLNLQVHELSEQIRRTENKMIEDFEQAKSALDEESFKGEALGQCLQFLNARQYTDSSEFRRNISQILKNVSFNAKSEVIVQGKEEQIVQNYQSSVEVYKDNIMIIQAQIRDLYESLHEKSMKEKVEKVVFDSLRPKTAQVSILKPENVTFSPTLKAANIKIEKDGKTAKLSDQNGGKIFFMQNAVSSKIFQVTVKIVNLMGNIALGVGFKDKLKQKLFKFQKTPNHGVFMIGSNTFKWNTSESNQNGISNSFAFGKDDEVVISLKLKEKKVVFTVKNDEKKRTELSFKSVLEKNLKELEFCACFTAHGDQIQII